MPSVSFLSIILLLLGAGTRQGVQVPQEDLHLRSFVVAAYPELAGKPLQIEAIPRGADVTVVVREVVHDITAPDRSINNLLLTGTATFSTGHHVQSFHARGPFLKDEDNRGLSQVVRDAQASGADISAAIATRAPAYGPDRRTAVTEKLARMRLDQALNPIEVTSLTAVTPPPDTRYGFVWNVNAVTRGTDGIVRTYVLTVEPFSGRLVAAREQE